MINKMIDLIKRIFCKEEEKPEIPVDYRLSIKVDRTNPEHVDVLETFIDELNKSGIPWDTFIDEQHQHPSMISYYKRYAPLNVCVKMENKDVVMNIHKRVYGY